jgi:hypothetical protein
VKSDSPHARSLFVPCRSSGAPAPHLQEFPSWIGPESRHRVGVKLADLVKSLEARILHRIEHADESSAVTQDSLLGYCQPKSPGPRFAPAAFPISGSSHRFLVKTQGETRRPGTFVIRPFV